MEPNEITELSIWEFQLLEATTVERKVKQHVQRYTYLVDSSSPEIRFPLFFFRFFFDFVFPGCVIPDLGQERLSRSVLSVLQF